MKKLIVGCGYLGHRVAASWLEQGHQVTGAVRTAAGAERLRRDNIEPIVCDVVAPESLTALPAADVILFCVGLDRTSGQSMRDVYIQGLANVLAQLKNCPKWVSISSTSIYGQDDGSIVDETSETKPQETSGRIVLEAEQRLHDARPDAIILRFAGIYGPGRLLRRRTIEAGEPIVADAERWLNLIHVDDGAAAVLHAEECCKTGDIYNVADGNPTLRRAFYVELAKRLRAPAPNFTRPDPNQPPPHEKANRRIANDKLCSTGWKPRFATFEDGLDDAVGNG